MALDPRHLRTYLMVCRANSISEAARRMNISQPSVSVAVAQLEHTVGAKLFERGRNGIQLTAAGQALRRRAEAMEAILLGAQREVSLLEAGVAGPLTVAGTPGALASLIPPAVMAFHRATPRFDLRVLERTDQAVMELLRNEQIELALVTTGLEAPPDDILEEDILRDPFALIVGQANASLADKVRLRDVADLPWVLPEAHGAFRRQVDALFIATDTRTPLNLIRCDSLLTTKALVSQSERVTILPRQVVSQELALGVVRALEIDGVDFVRTVGVRRLAQHRLSPVVEAFLTALREVHAS